MKKLLTILVSLCLISICLVPAASAVGAVVLDHLPEQAQEQAYIDTFASNRYETQVISPDGQRRSLPIAGTKFIPPTAINVTSSLFTINVNTDFIEYAFLFYASILFLFFVVVIIWICQNHKSKKAISALDAELSSRFIPARPKENSEKTASSNKPDSNNSFAVPSNLSLSEKVKRRDFLVAKPARMRYFFLLCYTSPVWLFFSAVEILTIGLDYSPWIFFYLIVRWFLALFCVISLRSFSKSFLSLGSVLVLLNIFECCISCAADSSITNLTSSITLIVVLCLQFLYFYKRRFYFCIPTVSDGPLKK